MRETLLATLVEIADELPNVELVLLLEFAKAFAKKPE